MPTWYQHLPEYLDPIALMIGPVEIRWYSLMYLVGFLLVWWLVRWRLAHEKRFTDDPTCIDASALFDLLVWGLIGAVIGGRLGYVLFYEPTYFIGHPLEIFLPYDLDLGSWTGIYGMSFHGGLIGALIAGWLYCRRYNFPFLKTADIIIPAVPLGYFFGRVGNFMNGELYGRQTSAPAGMYFDGVLRHPSQLYEACFEGLILFIVLWLIRKRSNFPGYLLSIFVMAYAIVRFVSEFFRQPDAHLGFVLGQWMTMGHALSIGMFVIGAMSYIYLKKRA